MNADLESKKKKKKRTTMSSLESQDRRKKKSVASLDKKIIYSFQDYAKACYKSLCKN